MKILFTSLLFISLMFSSFAIAASPDTAELEKKLKQQEQRIDRLEREVESLLDSRYGGAGERSQDINALDPLVGNWECANNVFTYDISFFDSGFLVQEDPFLTTVKNSRWSRISDNQFATDQGQSFSTNFHSNDDLTVTSLVNNGTWECSRKK